MSLDKSDVSPQGFLGDVRSPRIFLGKSDRKHQERFFIGGPLEDCLRLMGENTIFHLIVIDEKQGFQGMLSVSEIFRMGASDEEDRADLLASFIFPPR